MHKSDKNTHILFIFGALHLFYCKSVFPNEYSLHMPV